MGLPAIRVLVTGGRGYQDRAFLWAALDRVRALREIERLAQGEAPGADTLAREWAIDRGVPWIGYPALWKVHGKWRAGPIRNRRMFRLEQPHLVVAFPGGTGTDDMVDVATTPKARQLGTRLYDLRRSADSETK